MLTRQTNWRCVLNGVYIGQHDMATSEVCSKCAWKQEDHGGQLLEVCVNCGKCKDFVAFDNEEAGSSLTQESMGAGFGYAYAGGPTSHGKFHTPRDAARERERRFIGFVRQAGRKVMLPRESINICISEAKSLLERNENLGHKMKKFAAGLVFIELKKRLPTISHQKVAEKLDMKKQALGKAVSKLRAASSSCSLDNGRDVEVSFEARLQDVQDKLTLKLSPERSMKTRKLANDLKELCSDVTVQGHLILNNESADFAFFALALQVIDQKENDKAILNQITQDTGLRFTTLTNRVWQIRTSLTKLAKTLPSLEHMTEDINVRKIHRYIPTIIRNKTFLVKGKDRFSIGASDDQEGASDKTSLYNPSTSFCESWEDEEGTLSDLDPEIEEYIASEKEVMEKKMMSQKYHSTL